MSKASVLGVCNKCGYFGKCDGPGMSHMRRNGTPCPYAALPVSNTESGAYTVKDGEIYLGDQMLYRTVPVMLKQLNSLASKLAEAEKARDLYKDDFQRTEQRLKAALDQLRCPECGCADEVDAQSQECGCDSPLCERNDGKTLAQAWLDSEAENARLREGLEFYANPKSWEHAVRACLVGVVDGTPLCIPAHVDRGSRAVIALTPKGPTCSSDSGAGSSSAGGAQSVDSKDTHTGTTASTTSAPAAAAAPATDAGWPQWWRHKIERCIIRWQSPTEGYWESVGNSKLTGLVGTPVRFTPYDDMFVEKQNWERVPAHAMTPSEQDVKKAEEIMYSLSCWPSAEDGQYKIDIENATAAIASALAAARKAPEGLLAAAQPFLDGAQAKIPGMLHDTSWNPDFHIEFTVSIAEVQTLDKAAEAARK